MTILKSANEFYFRKRTTVIAKKVGDTILLMGTMSQAALIGAPLDDNTIKWTIFLISIFMIIAKGIANLFKEDDFSPYTQTDTDNPNPNSLPDENK